MPTDGRVLPIEGERGLRNVAVLEAALALAEHCRYLLTWRLWAKAQVRMGNKYSEREVPARPLYTDEIQ
jgi:hypothetical protein